MVGYPPASVLIAAFKLTPKPTETQHVFADFMFRNWRLSVTLRHGTGLPDGAVSRLICS
jgi:hypothetical protein